MKEKTKEELITEIRELRKRVKKFEVTFGDEVKERTTELTKANEGLQKEIADRKMAEEELRKSEERYQHLVEFANVGIIAAEGRKITQVNKRAEEIYGYSKEELLGHSASILTPDEYKGQHSKILKKMLKSERVKMLSFEEEGLRKDGTLFPVEMSFSLSKREDGFGVIAVIFANRAIMAKPNNGSGRAMKARISDGAKTR